MWNLGSIVQFSSVTQSCPTLCNPMNCGTPGLPVHHQLSEFAQTHVRWVSDAIQPSHPLSPPSPPALNLTQHQGLFKWVSSSHQVAKVLEFQLNSSPYFIKLGHQQFLSVIWKKESNDLLRKGYWNAVYITYDELSYSISCSMGGLRGHRNTLVRKVSASLKSTVVAILYAWIKVRSAAIETGFLSSKAMMKFC